MLRKEKDAYLIGIVREEGAIYGVRLAAELLSKSYEVYFTIPDTLEERTKETKLYGEEILSWVRELSERHGERFHYTKASYLLPLIKHGEVVFKDSILIPFDNASIGNVVTGLCNDGIDEIAALIYSQHKRMLTVTKGAPTNAYEIEAWSKLINHNVKVVPMLDGFNTKSIKLGELVDEMVNRILETIGLSD